MAIDVNKTLDRILVEAKRERSGYRYSEDERMGNTCVIIGPNDETAAVPLNWRDSREKQMQMKSIAYAAKMGHAQAVMLISDTRWTKGDVFALHFGIPGIGEVGIEKFQTNYWMILSTLFGGQIKNLPHELWNEAVMVAIKGPSIEPQMRMAAYCQGPDDSVEYYNDGGIGDDFKNGLTQLEIIPDWWKP